MKALLTRPTRLVALVFALTLTLALVALALSMWFDRERLASIRSHVNRASLLQQSLVGIKDIQLRMATGGAPPSGAELLVVREYLAQIPVKGAPVREYMLARLREMDALLTRAESEPLAALALAQSLVAEMLSRENRIQLDLIDKVYEDTRVEARLAWGALLVFPVLVVFTLWVLRRRIFQPIDDLRDLLSRLTNGDFTPIPLHGVDPLILPLFQNYNRMVTRMSELERINQQRTLSLQQEVRAATRALLQQHQSLSHAERLAATGAISARLAHELRNPLAGIQLALENLRQEQTDPDVAERMDMVIGEARRIARLLSALLQQSRHDPEAPRPVLVPRLVQELATLLRYQFPPHIQLVVEVAPDLRCRLPEDGVRQALLNLVLNAVAIMEDTPGNVTIRVDRSGDTLHIQVSDEGPGFSESMLRGGIRPFATARHSGTGLGLAIVEQFARDFGGQLTIGNRAPKGALVTLKLPYLAEHVGHAIAD